MGRLRLGANVLARAVHWPVDPNDDTIGACACPQNKSEIQERAALGCSSVTAEIPPMHVERYVRGSTGDVSSWQMQQDYWQG
jgi:hypothetical protein